MTPEQAAAFVMAQAACAVAEIEAMKAANAEYVQTFNENARRGVSTAFCQPHTDEGFRAVADRFCIGHNAVLQLFQDMNR